MGAYLFNEEDLNLFGLFDVEQVLNLGSNELNKLRHAVYYSVFSAVDQHVEYDVHVLSLGHLDGPDWLLRLALDSLDFLKHLEQMPDENFASLNLNLQHLNVAFPLNDSLFKGVSAFGVAFQIFFKVKMGIWLASQAVLDDGIQ